MKRTAKENDVDVEAWDERADEPMLFTKVSPEEQAKYDEYYKTHPFPNVDKLIAEIKRAQNS